MRLASAIVILAACSSETSMPPDAPQVDGGIDAPRTGFNCGMGACSVGETCTTEGYPDCVMPIRLCTCTSGGWNCVIPFDCSCPDAAPTSGVVCGDNTLRCNYPGPTCCSCYGSLPARWDCEPGECIRDGGTVD